LGRSARKERLEEEAHSDLHYALTGFAVDAAKRKRVGVSDDVSKCRMVEDIEGFEACFEKPPVLSLK
jgi:hypothetical protein